MGIYSSIGLDDITNVTVSNWDRVGPYSTVNLISGKNCVSVSGIPSKHAEAIAKAFADAIAKKDQAPAPVDVAATFFGG